LWEEIETKFHVDVVTSKEMKSRFRNRKKKNDDVYSDIADKVNRRFPDRPIKSRQRVRNKYDNIVRAHKKYRMCMDCNDGRRGGSGIGRDLVEKPAPTWYQELLDA